VGHVVFLDVRPHLLERPRGQRVELHEPERLIPLDDSGVLPRLALLAADAGDPRLARAERLLQRHDLPRVAALVRLALPQAIDLRGRRPGIRNQVGTKALDADAVALL